jgi:hypothetical protein
MADVIYFNSLSGKRGKYGIRISGNADKVIEEIRKHTNAKGYINLEVKERREEGKYGQTHYVVVDTYQSRNDEQAASPPPASQQGWAAPTEGDDFPF